MSIKNYSSGGSLELRSLAGPPSLANHEPSRPHEADQAVRRRAARRGPRSSSSSRRLSASRRKAARAARRKALATSISGRRPRRRSSGCALAPLKRQPVGQSSKAKRDALYWTRPVRIESVASVSSRVGCSTARSSATTAMAPLFPVHGLRGKPDFRVVSDLPARRGNSRPSCYPLHPFG